MPYQPPHHYTLDALQYQISQQQTIPSPAVSSQVMPTPEEDTAPIELSQQEPTTREIKKKKIMRLAAVVIVLLLGAGLYLTWRPAAPAASTTAITQPGFNTAAVSTVNNTTMDSAPGTSGGIQVYVVGAVQHPGVYTLGVNARVYQLLQAAGGPLPTANLAALNLAARLNDGQEVYVGAVGETPPANMGGSSPGGGSPGGNTQVNINSASANDLRQRLHLSLKVAQSIVTYRQQHGAFSTIDGLLQVVSQSIYNKIKGMVTV